MLGEVLNVGSGKTVSVNQIAKLLGGKKLIFLGDQESPILHLQIFQKIKRKKLDGYSKISINHGIKIMLKNIND